jgi:hypothetical protein
MRSTGERQRCRASGADFLNRFDWTAPFRGTIRRARDRSSQRWPSSSTCRNAPARDRMRVPNVGVSEVAGAAAALEAWRAQHASLCRAAFVRFTHRRMVRLFPLLNVAARRPQHSSTWAANQQHVPVPSEHHGSYAHLQGVVGKAISPEASRFSHDHAIPGLVHASLRRSSAARRRHRFRQQVATEVDTRPAAHVVAPWPVRQARMAASRVRSLVVR